MGTLPELKESPRQAEILDRTLDLVREGGLGGLTTRKIAERVGFSEAALYRHFPTKKALVLGLMDRLENMLLTPAQRIAADRKKSVEERLERLLLRHLQLIRKQNSLPILLLAEASVSDDPVLLGKMRHIFQAYLSVLETLLRGLPTEENAAVGTDCLAMMLLGSAAALAIRHRILPDAGFEDRFEEKMVPFLLQSMGAGRSR